MHLLRPTRFQREIAKHFGISLRGASQSVAAARIHDFLEPALAPGSKPREPTEKQVKFAVDLGVYTSGDSFRVCSVRIDEELFRRNREAVARLRLKPGDTVVKAHSFALDNTIHTFTSHHVVSSIGQDLRVYFKNPSGDSGAWPSQLVKVRKAHEPRAGLAKQRGGSNRSAAGGSA